jgi:2-methylcitrate dehydratase PrpD
MFAGIKILSVLSAAMALSAGPTGPDRNLHDERGMDDNSLSTKPEVEYLQKRLENMSMKCEGKSYAFCKEIPDIDNDIKELRGEADKNTPYVTARIKAVNDELLNMERKFMAEYNDSFKKDTLPVYQNAAVSLQKGAPHLFAEHGTCLALEIFVLDWRSVCCELH